MFEQVRQFIREVKVEMKKVSWPTREDLTGSTTAVIVTVALVAMYIFAVDWGISRVYGWASLGISKVLTALTG